MANTRRTAAPATAPMRRAAKPKIDKQTVVDGFEFEFGDLTYTVAPAEEWTVDAHEAMEDGKAVSFIRAVLGPEQWAAFKRTNPTQADLNGLGEAMMSAVGLGN